MEKGEEGRGREGGEKRRGGEGRKRKAVLGAEDEAVRGSGFDPCQREEKQSCLGKGSVSRQTRL